MDAVGDRGLLTTRSVSTRSTVSTASQRVGAGLGRGRDDRVDTAEIGWRHHGYFPTDKAM